MALFLRSSVPRLFSFTAVPSLFSSHLPATLILRNFCHSGLPRAEDFKAPVEKLRNIWVSGLTFPDLHVFKARKLLYTGQINELQEIIRRDAILRNEICIPHLYMSISPLTVIWKDYKINIVDTVDRTVFFRKDWKDLHVADGAILVLSSVLGVNSKSEIVDEKMEGYEIPRLVFIDKLDQEGANPWEVLDQTRSKLGHHSAAIQVPIGLGSDFKGVVDLVQLKAYSFHGENVVSEEVPEDMEPLVSGKRRELIETVSEVDDKLAEDFRCDIPISSDDLEEAIRRATIARKFIPVFMGSALNKGLSSLLDGVISYFPCPIEVSESSFDTTKNKEKIPYFDLIVRMLGPIMKDVLK